MSKEQVQDCILQLFESSCIELFKYYNCGIYKSNHNTHHLDNVPVAYIDAGSNDVEILLTLRVPFSVLAMSYPIDAIILELDDTVLEDWILELSNQLMGNLKNKLINYGTILKLGLPDSYFDSNSNDLPAPATEGEKFIYNFCVDNEIFECCIYIEIFNPDLNLIKQNEQDYDIAIGDIELF